MDKRKSLINVSISIFFKVFMLIGSILVRRCLIQYVGNEVNGLNSLYLSIMGFLSVAELGVGSAITFSMYKPIVQKDDDKVAALYQVFKKSYRIIGAVIFIAGMLLMPFLPYFAKDYATLGFSLYKTFFLMLFSVVLSYMFSEKTSLINAYKDNYITTTISSLGMIFQYILQIIVLNVTGSFYYYLVCRIVAILAQWGITEICVRTKHNDIIHYKKQTLEADTKQEVMKNIKALFMHRIGGIFVNSTDSAIISAFIGIGVLGKYSNYTTIVLSMTSVINLFFTPLTSIIGHMCISEAEQTKKYYNFFHSFNYAIGTVFFLGYYAVIDNLIVILFGENLEVAKTISFVITVNYFIQFMRQATLLFRDATGTFYYDRWKPLFEGLLNVILSITFVLLFTKWCGESFGVVGVILATIITNLLICHITEPYVLYKHVFHESPKVYWIKNYSYIAIFIVVLCIMSNFMVSISNPYLESFINGSISLVFSGIIIVVIVLTDRDFRQYCLMVVRKIGNEVKNI